MEKENGNYYSILRTKFKLGVTDRGLHRVVGGEPIKEYPTNLVQGSCTISEHHESECAVSILNLTP